MLRAAAASQPVMYGSPSWQVINPIANSVHSDISGTSTISDMRPLLHRKGILLHDADAYFSLVVEDCRAFRATALSQMSLNVSLTSLSRQFNDVFSFGHPFLDGAHVFHAMDACSRYSTAIVCDEVSILSTISPFETLWVSRLWPPESG